MKVDGHCGDSRDWTEPLAPLNFCNVFFKYENEFECTIDINYMSIWFKGSVFACIGKEADVVDRSGLVLVRM